MLSAVLHSSPSSPQNKALLVLTLATQVYPKSLLKGTQFQQLQPVMPAHSSRRNS